MPLGVYVTASDAAHWAGRPVGTIWRWASEGRIARTGTGKAARYLLSSVPKAGRDEYTGELLQPADPPALPDGARAA